MRAPSIAAGLGLAASLTLAQPDRPPAPDKSLVLSGCVRKGVECVVIVSADGKQKYALGGDLDGKIVVGNAYEITGTLAEMSVCMEGAGTLVPASARKVALDCPAEDASGLAR